MRALVIDDDIAGARAVGALISRSGYEVEIASNGQTGMDRADADAFDLIVCDWMLPDVDGPDVIRYLRKGSSRDCVIVGMSGIATPEARAHFARAGADEFLPKPINVQTLAKGIRCAQEQRKKVGTSRDGSANGSRAWATIVEGTRAILSECIGVELAVAPKPTVLVGPWVSARLAMVSVAQMTQLEVNLFASIAEGQEIARVMIQEEKASQEMLRDLLGELSNNVLGTAKTALRQEGFEFTLGVKLPEAMETSEVVCGLSPVVSVAYEAGPIRIHAALGMRPAPTLMVHASHFDESMVLAEPVYNATGALIATIGTRLTEATAARVGAHVARRAVRVCRLTAA